MKKIRSIRIRSIRGGLGYDSEGNTYTRGIKRNSKNNRVWDKWEKNNNLSCSGRPMKYYKEEYKQYKKILNRCKGNLKNKK